VGRCVGGSLLVALGVLLGAAPAVSREPAPLVASPADIETQAKIVAALERPVDWHFADVALEQVAQRLQQDLQIPVLIDPRQLPDEDRPPTVNFAPGQALPARLALDLLLEPLDRDWMVRRGVLLITSFARAERAWETRVYDVADLAEVAANRARTAGSGRLQTLVDAIQATVEPGTWSHDGLEGAAVKAVEAPGVSALVVSQNRLGHEGVARLLADLRAVRGPLADAPRPRRKSRDRSPPPTELERELLAELHPPRQTVLLSAADEQLRKALTARVTLEFKDRNIADVAGLLRPTLGVPVVLDETILSQTDGGLTQRLTLPRCEAPGREGLNRLLAPAGLGWCVRQGTLVITTAAEAEATLVNRVYDVHDLTAFRDEDDQVLHDGELLIDTIISTIAPDTWEDVDGPGAIEVAYARSRMTLAVSQTWQVHESIEALLEQLRAKRRPVTSVADLPLAPVEPEESEEPEDEVPVATLLGGPAAAGRCGC